MVNIPISDISEPSYYIKKILFESIENEFVDLVHITKENYLLIDQENIKIQPEIIRTFMREISLQNISDKYREDIINTKYIEIKKHISEEDLTKILDLDTESEQQFFFNLVDTII